MHVLFFGKKGHWAIEHALRFLETMPCACTALLGKRGDPLPAWDDSLPCDLLLSFSSPWIIPARLLEQARIAALNFHPGPPEYPGIGCTNFAIYHEEERFGITCHQMHAKVDTGPIVAVRRFPLYASDSVKRLTDRCYHHMSALFVEVIGALLAGEALPTSEETWTRRPYTRKQLNALGRIEADMPAKEVERRVRAMAFPGYPGAFMEFHGIRFDARPPTE